LWGAVGNAELEPERSLGWDLGLEQMLFQDRFMLGFTYFSNDFENLIDFQTFSGYINIAEASTRGVELFGRFRISKLSQIETGYTRTDSRDTKTGEALLRRPKHKFDLKLSGRLYGLADIHVSLTHVSEREDLDFSRWPAIRTALEEYTLVNGALSFELSSCTQIFFRLENILDKSYELVKGYGTPGFSLYGGIKLRL
jgi:vitamin B12 transporter